LFAQRYRHAVDGLSAIFNRCAERGELAPATDCVRLARECIAVSDGLQLQWVLADGGLDLAAAIPSTPTASPRPFRPRDRRVPRPDLRECATSPAAGRDRQAPGTGSQSAATGNRY